MDVISISGKSSSLTKRRETLKDIAQRTSSRSRPNRCKTFFSGSPLFHLSRTIGVPIVNAGDGAHEHPSQGLLDIFTLENIGSLKGRKITILGDILFSRVARSNLWGLKKLGHRVPWRDPRRLCLDNSSRWGSEFPMIYASH